MLMTMMMCVCVCVCAQSAVCDYNPVHFIRCHFGGKNAIKEGHTDSDPTDGVTNVWCCAMEPDPDDSGLRLCILAHSSLTFYSSVLVDFGWDLYIFYVIL